MDVNTLMDLALKKSGITSQNKLARELGAGTSNLSSWRRGWTVPGDNYLLSLCKLARVQPEIGLLWVAAWRASGEARDRYERMALAAESQFGFTSEDEEAA